MRACRILSATDHCLCQKQSVIGSGDGSVPRVWPVAQGHNHQNGAFFIAD